MQSPRAFLLRSLALALGAGAGPALGGIAADQQWRCTAAPDGGWDCRAEASAPSRLARAGRMPVPAGQAPRAAPAAEPPADALSASMDWVPRERIAAGTPTGPHCAGAYVEPPVAEGAGASAVFGTIQASADESELQQSPEIARFTGNVTVRQDQRRLRADEATYYRAEDRIAIAGNVQYREPGLLVRGDSAEMQTARDEGELSGARFVMHREHARGEAAKVRRNADRSVDLEDGSYTRCEPGRDDWELQASRIHLDRATGQGTARDARLRVKGVPVLYTPYLRFPIDERRTSGFLWPVFTNSSQNGFDAAAPYYLNLAPDYDATLVPRYMNDRGAMAGGEFRYLNRWSQWTATGAVLPDDDVYGGEDRWLASLQQGGLRGGNVMTAIDYTEVSDEDYLRNLGATGLEVKRTTHLAQSGAVGWSPGRDWLLSARAQQYQLLDDALDEPYKMLPRIELSRSFTGMPFAPDYQLLAEYTAFEHKDTERLTGQRLYLEPALAWPMEWASAFVRPSVGYQSISYTLDEGVATAPRDDSPSVAAPMASLDAGYFLERDTRLFGNAFVQTLEPRAFYLWVDREDHSDVPNFDTEDLTFTFSQLFRTTRFAGHDRIADANQASVSLTSRLVDDASGREVASASLGQIRYFEDRRVSADNTAVPDNQSTSAIAAELQVQPDARLSITGSTLWDPREDRVDEGGMLLHWTPDEQTILNLGYRYRRDQPLVDPRGFVSIEDIDQADFSTALPIGRNWKLLARYQYDLTNDESLEETAGIEYSACCWALRVVYQEGVDWDQGRDYGVYMEFVLRGLGSLGKNIDQLLQKSIFGYGEFDRDYRLVN